MTSVWLLGWRVLPGAPVHSVDKHPWVTQNEIQYNGSCLTSCFFVDMLKCQSAFPCTSVHLAQGKEHNNLVAAIHTFYQFSDEISKCNKMSKVAVVMSLHVPGASSEIGMFGGKRFGQRCPAGVRSMVGQKHGALPGEEMFGSMTDDLKST